MIWLNHQRHQIRPVLNSLRGTITHRQHIEIQEDLYIHQKNWKIVGSIVSLIIFLVLFVATIIGLPIIIIKTKQESLCPTTAYWIEFSTSSNFRAGQVPSFSIPSSTNGTEIDEGSIQLCTTNASWNPIGVTVAGLASGLPSTSLEGLLYPHDIYVYGNGTVLVADLDNNRVTKWDPNATRGVIVAGTGSYGSWSNLFARPLSLAVRGEQLYVSDLDNYRIQVFPLNTNLSSPDAATIIGRYGQGPALNQINQVASIVAPIRFPSLLYLSDSINHRILVWDLERNMAEVVAGISGIVGSDSIHLYNPFGIALNERNNSLYIADRSNNRIQKYDMNGKYPSVTVAGWGQLNTPYAVQLDPSGLNMFIADTANHRILLWFNNALQGRIIAGNGTGGNSIYQLNSPTQIRFDSNYNLYVVDTNNCRIQRFDLVSNGC